MSLIEKIKEKIIGKRQINETQEDLKYAVERKPTVNLDKYNPFPTPEQLMKENKKFEKEKTGIFEKMPDIPNFEPMNMPLKSEHLKNEKQIIPVKSQDNDNIKFIMEQLESIRSQNEMIIHRLKNIEMKLNEH